MYLVDALLVLAMLFFLFLPITDRKTAQMKLAVLCTLLALFAASVMQTRVSRLQFASIASTR
jgi:hypothetical protein